MRAARDSRRRGLRSRRSSKGATLALAVVLALASIVSGCRRQPPNIVLITIDTLRADRVGLYGNPDGLTPNIDRLGEDATVFASCVSPIGTTIPSHASLFTGLYPRSHGARHNTDLLDERLTTLAEHLSTAGYATAAFISLRPMKTALSQGFDVSRWVPPEGGHPAPPKSVNRAFFTWFASRSRGPFFAWIHHYSAHSPYAMTPYARDKLASYDGPYAKGIRPDDFYRTKDGWMQNERDREAVRTIYDGTVQRIDEAVGQVVAALQESGELDRTLLIVTSDHGQSLGDHLAPGHMRLLWNSVLDVPLIVRDGRNPQPRRIDTRVSLVDLTPTVLDVLGLPMPEGLHGRSLRAALEGGRLAERPYFAEIQKEKQRSEWKDRVAVFDGQFKLIERLGGAQAFDLAADPDELSPLQGDKETEVRSRLESLAASFQQLPAWGESAENLSPEDLETLRSLGYLD